MCIVWRLAALVKRRAALYNIFINTMEVCNVSCGKRLFLLDMDGTIYLSETLFDGTLDFLRYVRAIGGRYLFLTNNSSRGTDAYIAKMARLGIEAFPDDFLTSADAAIRYLRGRYLPDTVYYVCGTESLKNQLRLAGLRVAETLRDDCAVVLLGYDTELTYEKLEIAASC